MQLRIQLRAQLDAQIEAQLGESWAQIEAFLPLLEPILVSHSIHIVQIKEQETIFRKHFFLIFSHSIYLAKIFLCSLSHCHTRCTHLELCTDIQGIFF